MGKTNKGQVETMQPVAEMRPVCCSGREASEGRETELGCEDRVGGQSRQSGECICERYQNPTAHQVRQSRKNSSLKGFQPASQETQGYRNQEFHVAYRLRGFTR